MVCQDNVTLQRHSRDCQRGPRSPPSSAEMRQERGTHPVVQLNDEVIGSFVASELEVHDPVYPQLFGADESSGL